MPSIIHSQVADIPYNMTTTGFDVPGFRIVDNLGVVRGVVVRSRSVFGTVGASLQTLLGGNISLFTELAERTRKQAFNMRDVVWRSIGPCVPSVPPRGAPNATADRSHLLFGPPELSSGVKRYRESSRPPARSDRR